MKALATLFIICILISCKKNEELPASVYTPNLSDTSSYFIINSKKYLAYGRQINWYYPNYKTFYVIKFDDEDNHKGDYYAMYFTLKSNPVNKRVYYANTDNDTLTYDSTYFFLMERYFENTLYKYVPLVPRIKGMPLTFSIDGNGKKYFSFGNTEVLKIIPSTIPREILEVSAKFEYLEK